MWAKELRELGLIQDAALLVEDGRIVAAGTYADICSQLSPATTVIDAGGRCVTPGFVDAHTHLVFAGNRAAEFEQRIAGHTYQEIAAAGGGILRTVALTRAASEDELLAEAPAASRLDAALGHDDHRSEVRLRAGSRNGTAYSARDCAA